MRRLLISVARFCGHTYPYYEE